MTSIDKLPNALVEAARQTLGVDAGDTSRDALIESMNARTLVSKYTQWHLGDRSWGTAIYDYIKEIEP
jgi:hypothetical protein